MASNLEIALGETLIADIRRLLEETGKIARRVVVMFDALDEAADGQGARIAAELITPLGRLPRVKVLVGSRRSLDGRPVPEDEERHRRLREAFPEAKITRRSSLAGYCRAAP